MRLIFIYILLFFSFSFDGIAQNSAELFASGVEFRNLNKKLKAISKFEEAVELAVREQDIELQMRCHLELAELKDNVIQYKEALKHYQDFADLYKNKTDKKQKVLATSVDSLENSVQGLEDELVVGTQELLQKKDEVDSLTRAQLISELDIRDLELKNSQAEMLAAKDENRKNILILIGIAFALLAVIMARGYLLKRRTTITLRQKNYLIVKEKQKSDDLLLNILPEAVANELKEFGRTTSARFEQATVMFTDFKGFTKFSEDHSPEELVKMVDFYFSAFDAIVAKHRVEKIKTIGDAYLCVSGVPESSPNDVNNCIEAALEIAAFVSNSVRKKKDAGLPFLEIRIGIHAGPLVAGVVGSMKFAYDVWGDTVNIAARMEQASEVGEINVSETVYDAVKTAYEFHYRGEIEAKNKGKLKMYFLARLKD